MASFKSCYTLHWSKVIIPIWQMRKRMLYLETLSACWRRANCYFKSWSLTPVLWLPDESLITSHLNLERPDQSGSCCSHEVMKSKVNDSKGNVVIVIQSLNCVQLFEIPWTAAFQASFSFTISQSLLKLMSIELMIPFNHLILYYPLLLLPAIFPSTRALFQWVGFSHPGGQSTGASASKPFQWIFRTDFL